MATRAGSDPALKFHPVDSPAAAPMGIHLRTSKNDKMPPICAFLLTYNKLPKLRTWVRFPSPAPTFPDDPMEPLVDGTMPLPIDATLFEQRRATIAQQHNLVARLRKLAAWQREQQQEPQ
jgi:hypothetical protein